MIHKMIDKMIDKMSTLKILNFIFCFFFFLTHNTFALVDYSETVPERREVSRPNKEVSARSELRRNESSATASLGLDAHFSLGYLSQSYKDEAQLNATTFDFRIETPINLFLQANYWTGKGVDFANDGYNTDQNGNPEIKLGFNFFQVGTRQDLATLDLYAGAMLSSKSTLASSRKDQIYGIELSKRFFDTGLGISYELRATGNPESSLEYSIGNIQRFKMSFGWMVSEDIQFQTDFKTTSIGKGESGANILEEKLQYSTLSPNLVLGVAKFVKVNLGAHFLVSRPKTRQDLNSLKFFDSAPHGTALTAGLGFVF